VKTHLSKKEIRLLEPADLEEAMALVWEVFAEFQAPEFTQEGIEEFWRFIDGEYMNMMLGEGIMTFWGAFEDDLMVGVCAVRDNNHIALLFVDGEYHRRGIGSTLLKKAVADCKYLDPDLNRVTVNSSPFAVPFYEAMGFKALSGMVEEDGMKFMPMAVEGI